MLEGRIWAAALLLCRSPFLDILDCLGHHGLPGGLSKCGLSVSLTGFKSKYLFDGPTTFWTRLGWPWMLMRRLTDTGRHVPQRDNRFAESFELPVGPKNSFSEMSTPSLKGVRAYTSQRAA